jgi:hypothetical protein
VSYSETILPASVEAFIQRVRQLSDEERVVLADTRRATNELVRADAWRAAAELLPGRANEYATAWGRIGTAFIPERLEHLLEHGSGVDTAEIADWQEVARLARTAIDEALLALLFSDTLTPPSQRELIDPWQRAAAAAFEAQSRG